MARCYAPPPRPWRPPNAAFKQPKVGEEDKVIQIQPVRKAPRCTVLEKDDVEDDGPK